MREIVLVVVHGIGQQKVGQTAQRWSEAIVRFLWAQNIAVEVLDTDLTERPATSLLVIEDPGPQPEVAPTAPVRIRVVEAYWADAFPEPSAGRVLRWLVTVGPSLAMFQAWANWYAIRGRAASLWRWITALAPVAGGLVLLAVASPLILLLLLILLVASWLPFTTLKRAVGGILGSLATSIGDSFLFVADPVTRAAMVTRLSDVLHEQLLDAPAGSRTHVIAHSQGAAVTHRALSALAVAERPARLTTVGSAIGRLDDLTRLPRYAATRTTLANAAVLLLVGVLPWLDRPWSALALAAAGVVTLSQLVYWRAKVIEIRDEGRELLRPLEGVDWLDIWAPFDPVPNGQCVALDDPTYRHQSVPGDLSVLRDHVRYEKDFGESMPRILQHITEEAGAVAVDDIGVRASRGLPAGRDWTTFAFRVTALVLGLVVASFADLYDWGLWLRSAAPSWLESVVTPIFRAVEAAVTPLRQGFEQLFDEQVLGALLLVGIGVAGAILVRRVFAVVQGIEINGWLTGRRRWSPRTWSAVLAAPFGALLITAGVLALLAPGPTWTPTQTTEAFVRAVAERDARSICELVAEDSFAGGGSCTVAAQEFVDGICADAVESYAAVGAADIVIGAAGDRRSVQVTWVPEGPPSCAGDGAQDAAGGIPACLERDDRAWRVTRIQAPDESIGCGT